MIFGEHLKKIFLENFDKIAIRFRTHEYTYSYLDQITDIIAFNIVIGFGFCN